MSVSGADENRIGLEVCLRGDASADVVGDADADCEQVDAGDRDLVLAVAQDERLGGQVVVHAGIAADAVGVADHRKPRRRIQSDAGCAGVESTHGNLADASSAAPEATLAAAATMSSTSRSSPSRHSCGIETSACSNRRSATGQSIATVSALAPASSQALR